MIIYIAISLLIVLLLLAATVPVFQKFERLLVSFSFLMIWFIVSFSANVGPDYESYKFMYDSLNENFFLQEFLFRQLGFLFRTNDLPFSAFYFFLTSVYVYCVYRVFLRYRNLSVLNLLIFIIMPYGLIEGGFNYLRQNMAVALFYLSIVYLTRQQFFRYSTFNFLGFLFHKSAFILIPLYFVIKTNLSIRRGFFIYFVVLGATLSLEVPFIKNSLLMVIGSIPGYGGTYANFRDGEFLNALSTKGIFSYIYQSIPIIVLMYYKKRVVITRNENVLFNITYLSLITLTIALELRIMLRVEYYFILAKVFALPLLVRLCGNNRTRTVFLLALVLYFSLYFIAVYMTGVEKNLLPYKSVLGFEVN
ncbi:TPA: EpsG family protein [Citrobacter koseri]|nr:EpsG family protein [Citrobacter koseri]HEJ0180275.1 EpsG family protein [Citrobacter koseri]